MLKYVLKRTIFALVTIFSIITITSFLMKAIPDNSFAAEGMPNPEVEAVMMIKYGLGQPLWKQYIIYLGNSFRRDFSVSYAKAGLTVNKVIADDFLFSLTIDIYASLMVMFVRTLSGSVCALYQNESIDQFLVMLSTLSSTIPSFVLAAGFPFLFGKTLGLVLAFGADEVAGYIGPVLVIGAFPLPFIAYLTYTNLVEVQQQDYTHTARSKGTSEFKAVCRHALYNALLPAVTCIGPMVTSIITGSFVIETVFSIPGVGQLFTDSIVDCDYPLIMGIMVFLAVLLVLTVLIMDLVHVLIDPRVRLD